jgi:GxxExxY protein
VYEATLAHELRARGLRVTQQLGVPVNYEGVRPSLGFRVDLVVDHKVVVEIKSVELIAPVHRKQLHTYLRLMGLHLGIVNKFQRRVDQERNSKSRKSFAGVNGHTATKGSRKGAKAQRARNGSRKGAKAQRARRVPAKAQRRKEQQGPPLYKQIIAFASLRLGGNWFVSTWALGNKQHKELTQQYKSASRPLGCLSNQE